MCVICSLFHVYQTQFCDVTDSSSRWLSCPLQVEAVSESCILSAVTRGKSSGQEWKEIVTVIQRELAWQQLMFSRLVAMNDQYFSHLSIFQQIGAFVCSMLSVFLLMMLMGFSGTLGMAIPWLVGYFYIFWLQPSLKLEHGIRQAINNIM